MAARCQSSLRAVSSVVNHSVIRGLTPAARPQHAVLALSVPQNRHVSSSSTRPSATALGQSSAEHGHSEAVQSPSTLAKRSAVRNHQKSNSSRAKQSQAHVVVRKIPFDNFMRMMAPETYDGEYLEAQSLDEAFAGIAHWADPKLADLASQPDKFDSALRDYLRNRSIRPREFLADRNAMLSQSWPVARRHMIDVADGQWPVPVLQRAIQTVTTPSELSDALALLSTTIQHALTEAPVRRDATLKAVRYCLGILIPITLKEHGNAFHLIPRLTDVLLALRTNFQTQIASSDYLVYDFTRRCSGRSDERARHAVLRVLDWLRNSDQSDQFDRIRRNVVKLCLDSVVTSMMRSRNRTASSESFVNIEMMEQLLREDIPVYQDLEQRALRCAVYTAGRGLDYARAWQWFNDYQQCKQEHGAAMTGSDYVLLAKALARTEQGRKDAWRVFLRAERLFPAVPQATSGKATLSDHKEKKNPDKELESTFIDLLQVMAKSPDVHLEKVLSMLAIYVRDSHYEEISARTTSKAIIRKRGDVYAYTMVMQGCLYRQRPEVAITVWKAMLDRGVKPNVACLSVLLQNLFQMRDVGNALQQLHLWCEEGVDLPAAASGGKFKDIEVETLSTPTLHQPEALSPPPALTSKQNSTLRHKIAPDPILASVVFRGLLACELNGIEALWKAYQQTIQLFPDAPVLALLLKASCGTESSSNIDARFGRQVFRSMLFAKHPDLADYRNPLSEQLEAHGTAGWIFSDDTMGSRMENWFASVFRAKKKSAESPVTTGGDLHGLVFSAKLFEHYVRLLLHLQHTPGLLVDAKASRQEFIDMLGWMKELNLTPTPTHLALTILEIEEHLLPAMAAQQMDVLDAWLADWLGPDRMPSEEVMQRHWQWKMERNGQRLGWFDRVTSHSEPSTAESESD